MRTLCSLSGISARNVSSKKAATGKDSNATRESTIEDLEKSEFLSLGVSKQLVNRLKESEITEPVEIQSLSLRAISVYRNVVIHSETGSGKTLAYLLPVIQQAKHICHTIIAVPTRELAYQVSKPGIENEYENLKQKPPKIVIGTPKILLSIIRDHEYLFSNVRRIVTDEIDKMLPPLPKGFKKLLRRREKSPKPLTVLLAVIQGIAKKRVQHIACSATVNQQMIDTLKDIGWGFGLKVIKSDQCNERSAVVPECIKHNYLMIPDESYDTKAAALSKVFIKTGKKPVLVFVHKDHSTSDYVAEMRDLNLNAVALYKELLGGQIQSIKQFLQDFRTGKISVVVASEEEVRGLDFKELDHVFLFNVPRSAEEYLHLAGRIGRLGREGMVTTLIPELNEPAFERLQSIYNELGVSPKKIVT
eukprot:gene12942-3701_t